MQYDPENPTTESQLSEICQVIANPNARRMIAMLASAPMSLRDMEERFDLTPQQLRSAAEMMVKLQLLKKSKGANPQRPVTYQLAEGGLRLVRSWLDRIASIQVGEG
jgi:DNA-binding MarR family transcriptional regulator